ncbi:cytochrome P450 [Nocardia australiensis]|uniref:cytochrome P450 n=1 Tax=Nocardia australiensis TaxID=2887191 RepID=UPI001D136837|nr:cytochrome P450 [Nocardia australiensis]
MESFSASLPLEALPYPPGRLPIIGDVVSVDRHHPTQHELKLTQGGLGPIFQRKLLGTRLVIVAGGRLAAQCNDETAWGRVLLGPLAKLRPIAPHGMFTASSKDPLWGQARRILTPGFAQAAMRTYHNAMASVADDLVAEWTSSGGDGVAVHSAMTRATLEVIARAGFGRDLRLFDPQGKSSDSHRFVRVLGRTLQWASESTNDVPVIGHARAALQAPRVRRDIASLQQYVDQLIAQRQRENSSDATDLLGLMLTATDPETGARLPAANVRDQTLTFLIAGHETTAALLEVALHHLARNPDHQDRIRAEVPSQTTSLGYEDVTRMRFTRQFLNECLRLWPPAPGYFRIARTDQNLGGYLIPAGRAVFVLALAAQRDPDVWGPDAEDFDPDRFDSAALRAFPDRFFQPWGTGPRSCIGRAFAMHEATLMLGQLVRAFDLRTTSAAPLTLRERGTLRPEPFELTARGRSVATATRS